MTFSGRCWRRQLAVLAIVTSLLSGCGTAGSDQPGDAACPPVVDYGAAVQTQAAAELVTLPDGRLVAAVLSDYAVMRDQARACAVAAEVRPRRQPLPNPAKRLRSGAQSQNIS